MVRFIACSNALTMNVGFSVELQPAFVPQDDVWSAAKYRSAARKYPCSSTVSPALSATMVCNQSAVASETCAPELSSSEHLISVNPFTTSRPRIREDVLQFTMNKSVAPKRYVPSAGATK